MARQADSTRRLPGRAPHRGLGGGMEAKGDHDGGKESPAPEAVVARTVIGDWAFRTKSSVMRLAWFTGLEIPDLIKTRVPVPALRLFHRPGAYGPYICAGAVMVMVAFGHDVIAPAKADDRTQVRLAVDHLIAAQLPSGLFSYDFDFLKDDRTGEDHIVRQAAAANVLAEYYLHTKDERMRPAIEAALKAFGEMSLPIGKRTAQTALERIGLLSVPIGRYKLRATLDWLGLLYRPDGTGKVVSGDEDYGRAHTGATALALLTELEYFRASGDKRFADLRRAWLEGLMSLHIAGRGFRYSPEVIDEEAYYNGESWLALAYYNDVFPQDQATAAVLSRVDDYLMEKYADSPRSPRTQFFHWGAMAAVVRFTTTSDRKFSDFAREQARHFLDALRPKLDPDRNSCALVEGLAAAAAVLIASRDDDTALLKRIQERIGEEMTKNRGLQIRPGQQRLELGGDASLLAPHLSEYAGAFLAGPYSPMTRIDLTQHCISAMIKLERYGLDSAE